jgi:hypothetical protein
MLGTTLNPRQFLDRVAAELAKIDPAEVQKLADLIHERYQAGRFVFVIGNGGSGSNASHFCEDLGKGTLAPQVLRRRHARSGSEDPQPDRQHPVHPRLGQRRGVRPRLRRAAQEPRLAGGFAHRHQRQRQQPEHPAGASTDWANASTG